MAERKKNPQRLLSLCINILTSQQFGSDEMRRLIQSKTRLFK